MAGREYKAKERVVQKMSREGLVEENLRSGKKRRIIKDNAVRIGDRPAEQVFQNNGRETVPRQGEQRLSTGPDNRGRQIEPEVRSPHLQEAPEAGPAQEGKRRRRARPDAGRSSQSDIREPEDAVRLETESDDQWDSGPGDDIRKTRKGEVFRESRMSLEYQKSRIEDDATEDTGRQKLKKGRIRTKQTASLEEPAWMRPRMAGKDSADYEDPDDAETDMRGPDGSSVKPGYSAGNRQSREGKIRERSKIFERPDPEESPRVAEETGIREEKKHPEESDLQGETGQIENTGREGEPEVSGETFSAESAKLDKVHEHSSAASEKKPLSLSDIRHERKKRQVREAAEKRKREESRLKESFPEEENLESLKDEIRSGQKKERLNKEQRKAGSRLIFEPDNGMVKGSGIGIGRKIISAPAAAAAGGIKKAAGGISYTADMKLREVEEDNTGLKASRQQAVFLEDSMRSLASRSRAGRNKRRARAARRKADKAGVSRFFSKEEGKRVEKAAEIEAGKKKTIRRFLQKKRRMRMYAAAKKEEKAVKDTVHIQQKLTVKAAKAVEEVIIRNRKILLILGVFAVIFLLASASLGSCTALIHGSGSSVVSTTYPSTDEDIYAVENRYKQLEYELNLQINRIKQENPDYDDYRFQIDEISHNPYHLISYFTTMYGEFTYDQVKDELEEIFRQQYGLSCTGESNVTVTETRKIRVGDPIGQVVTSGYCSCERCCGTNAGTPTASGAWPKPQHTIAVDASNPVVPMGTHVVMNGIEYVVEDTGPLRQYGVDFDVYYGSHEEALQHGHRTLTAYLEDSSGSREIEVTETKTIRRYSVVMTNHNLNSVLRARMTEDERIRYNLYNRTYGHRDYLFDLASLPVGMQYTIPPDALSDERFARMIEEAEKYLGVPYVWGGYSPSGFDCSGFVSWVINNCGNGWAYGRLIAEGLRQVCAYVPPEEAKPGDLIFFEKTYDTPGASHVAIYVGNGMMIHAGNPIQYTTCNTPYYQAHFMQFGRLP